MKKKLLVFHPFIAPYRIDFFNALHEAFDMKLYTYQENLSDNKFEYDKILKQLKFRPKYLNSSFYQIEIFKLIRNFNPNIILVPECGIISILSIIYRIIGRNKYKVISMIDDSYDMAVNGNQFSKKHEIAEKILIPMFDNIITVEPDVAKHFYKKYSKGIYFPIIRDENVMSNIYKHSLRVSEHYVDMYGLEGNKILLYVGRLINLKNLQRAISAFKKIKDNNIRFIIVGSGLDEKFLKALAQDDRRIIFTGRLEGESLYAWYNIANIFILPSYQEAFGAVTNEALLGGCTALISRKAGSQCLIKDNVNGNIFDPFNEEEIYKLLVKTFQKEDCITKPIPLKESKMTIRFIDCISNVIKTLKE